MHLIILLFISCQVFSQVDWINFNTKNSNIPYDKVNSIEFGSSANSNGIIFVGTAFGLGVLDIDNANFPNNIWYSFYEQENPNEGLIGNDIINIQKNTNGNMWICTTNGVSVLEYDSSMGSISSELWSYINTENSNITSNMVRTILFDNEITWLGTTSGLCKIENGNWELYNFETQNIFSNNIKKIIQNSETDNIYIGTVNGGYQIYNNTTFEAFNNLNSGLLDNTINDFVFDDANNLIITSPSAGLEILTSSGNWLVFNSETNPELPFYINSLNKIIVDNNNNLWISTFENGLIRYSNNTWTFYNEENSGLPDNKINCLKYDEVLNYLWIGTDTMGVVLLDLNNLNNEENLEQNTFNPYFEEHHLKLNCSENGLITIYDTSGKMINQFTLHQSTQKILLDKLEIGFYIVNYQTNDENISKMIRKTI